MSFHFSPNHPLELSFNNTLWDTGHKYKTWPDQSTTCNMTFGVCSRPTMDAAVGKPMLGVNSVLHSVEGYCALHECEARALEDDGFGYSLSLYGCETWTLRAADSNRLAAFETDWYRTPSWLVSLGRAGHGAAVSVNSEETKTAVSQSCYQGTPHQDWHCWRQYQREEVMGTHRWHQRLDWKATARMYDGCSWEVTMKRTGAHSIHSAHSIFNADDGNRQDILT